MNSFSRNSRRNILISFVLLGVVALIVSFSLTTLFINKQKSTTSPGSPTASSPVSSTCNGKGVGKNAAGAYTFSWLHVNAQGAVVDENNCVVHLVGLNMGGLFLGGAGHPNLQDIQWFKQHVPMNIVREAFNTYWWQTDVYVPDQHMHFRQWLQTVVK